MTVIRRTRLLALCAVAALAMGPLAVPGSAQQTTTPTEPPAASQVDDQQLKAFAMASLQVEELNNKWAPRLAEVESETEAQQIREQASAEMSAAVVEQGLTPQEYNAILQQVQTDPEMAMQVRTYRESLR